MRGTQESLESALLESLNQLTGADRQLLAKLAEVSSLALREMLAAAGIDDVEIDEQVLAQRLAQGIA